MAQLNPVTWTPEFAETLVNISAVTLRKMVKRGQEHGADCECGKCVAGWVSDRGGKVLINPLSILRKVGYSEAEAWKILSWLAGLTESGASNGNPALESGTAAGTVADPGIPRPRAPRASPLDGTNRGRRSGSGISARSGDVALDSLLRRVAEADAGVPRR